MPRLDLHREFGKLEAAFLSTTSNDYFIRKFRALFDDLLVVAPEGMHRFYLQGSSGRVGASWMTKEAREDDIADNLRWLQELDAHISAQYRPKRKLLLGFCLA